MYVCVYVFGCVYGVYIHVYGVYIHVYGVYIHVFGVYIHVYGVYIHVYGVYTITHTPFKTTPTNTHHEHTKCDVAPSIQLPINPHLWVGRPLRILLHARTNEVIVQNIHRLIGHPQLVEDLYNGIAKATLGKLLCALDEEHNFVFCDKFFQCCSELGGEATA